MERRFRHRERRRLRLLRPREVAWQRSGYDSEGSDRIESEPNTTPRRGWPTTTPVMMQETDVSHIEEEVGKVPIGPLISPANENFQQWQAQDYGSSSSALDHARLKSTARRARGLFNVFYAWVVME